MTTGNLPLPEEPSLKALRALIEIVKTGPPGIPTFAYGGMTDAFLLGNAAMYLDSTAIPALVRDPAKSKVAGKVGYGLHPKAVKYSTETGGFGIAISANSAKKEAAFLLLQWLTSKASDQKIARLGGMPNRLSTLRDPGVTERVPGIHRCSGKHQVCQPRLAAHYSGVARDLHAVFRNRCSRGNYRKEGAGKGYE